jgi:hypothetical protein
MHLPDAPLPEWTANFDAIVAGFERNGLAGPLNRYRNFTRDWEELAAFDDRRQPTISSAANATAPDSGSATRSNARPTGCPPTPAPTSSRTAATGSSKNTPSRSTRSS